MGHVMLIRHAKSSWDNPMLNDHDRPLNNRGKTDAPKIAREIAAQNRIPNLILCSSSRRTKDTLNAMLSTWNLSNTPVLYIEDLYHASAKHMLNTLKNYSEPHLRVALIGHNPGITEVANYLGAKELFNLPTCGVLDFNSNALKSPEQPELILFPKSLP